ncbi:protein kinase domain-containing protein [Prosthecobacter sp.]|uniref:protein kinase domain-containing protein n=1 Tax=Prosthecobacter sp. TaxID=1965333 RepID=UPI003784FE1D
MTPIPSHLCPQCGTSIPEESAHGLCPRCVYARALAPTVEGAFVSYVPPALDSVRAAFPHLEIIALIGSGGMGAVFKARQPQLDRFVALKILPSELAGRPGFSERFQREAQALARLSHPHIVTVHDFGLAGDFYFLLMEFIDGVNLRQLLQAKRLTPQEALSIVPPVCEALQCAHDHGIVHRDIKPENLLIDKAGTVKIADFGIAKIVNDGAELCRDSDAEASESTHGKHAAASMPLGTPDYAAPEQASGAADHRADIYSLGVVLYEMLTGERPTARLEAPSKRVQVDIRIDEIVLRALEKSPELRFATAAEFRTQVENLNHQPVRARYSSRRRGSLWLLSGGVFLALLALLLFVLASLDHKSPLGTNELLILFGLSLGIAWWMHHHRNKDISPPLEPLNHPPVTAAWPLPVAVLVLLGAGGILMGLGVYGSQYWGWTGKSGAMIAGAVLPLVAGGISGWRLLRERSSGVLGPVPRAVFTVVASLGIIALMRLPMTFWLYVAQRKLGSSFTTVMAMHGAFAQVAWVLQVGAAFSLYLWTQRRMHGASTKMAARAAIACFMLLLLHGIAPWIVVAAGKMTELQKAPIHRATTQAEKNSGGSSGAANVKSSTAGNDAPRDTPQESRVALKYLEATAALDRVKAEHPELVAAFRYVETGSNSMVLDATKPSVEPLQKFLAKIDQRPEAVVLSGIMTESPPHSPPGSGKVISTPVVYTHLGKAASFRTLAKDGLQIEFSIKAGRQTKVATEAGGASKFNPAAEREMFVLEGTVMESARAASEDARKVFLLPTLHVQQGGLATFTHRLQDGRDVELSLRLSYQSQPPLSKGANAPAPPPVKPPAAPPPNEIPFKGEPKLRYIAWMPETEDGWQLCTPGGETVKVPGDIPVEDWEWWKGGLLKNGAAAKINATSGWLMMFYSHPAIDERSEIHLSLFTPTGEEIKVNQRTACPREPKVLQADGWLVTGCRVPYASVKGQVKARLTLTAGAWWNDDIVPAGRTNNSGGGEFLTNSGEDANRQAFVTVITQDEDKFPHNQWEVLGRLHDGSDVRNQGSTAMNVQDQYVHTIFFAQPLSSFAGFIMRSRERKKFTSDGVRVPPALVAASEAASKAALQMRWVHETPSAETEPMLFAGGEKSETLNVGKAVLLDESALTFVEAAHWSGCQRIALRFTESGRQSFAQMTREGNGRRLAIVIDGKVRAAPMISAEIGEDLVEIDSNLTYEEGDDLAARLNTAMPNHGAPADESSKTLSRSRLPAPQVEIIQLEATAEEIASALPATPKRPAIKAGEKSVEAIKEGRALFTDALRQDDANTLLAALRNKARFHVALSDSPLSNITVRNPADSHIHLGYAFKGVPTRLTVREHQAAIIAVPDASSPAQVCFYLLRLE